MQIDKMKLGVVLGIGALLGAAGSVAFVANAQQTSAQGAAAVTQPVQAHNEAADAETNDGPDAAGANVNAGVAPSVVTDGADAAETDGKGQPDAADVTEQDKPGDAEGLTAGGDKNEAADGQAGKDAHGDGETNDDTPAAAQ